MPENQHMENESSSFGATLFSNKPTCVESYSGKVEKDWQIWWMISGMFTDSLLIPKDLEVPKGLQLPFWMLKQQHVPSEVLSEITIETLASFNGFISGKKETMVFIPEAQGVVFFQLSPAGTDTGLNFFYPGKTEEGAKLFVTGIACLSYGLAQYNES